MRANQTRRRVRLPAILLLSAALAFAQPQQQRLVQPGNLAYLGKFTVPATDGTGRATAEGLAEQLRAMLDALAKPLIAVDTEMERVLVALTLEAARRIAQQELNLDPTKVAAVVRDAVAGLGAGARRVAVYVNPNDYAALSEALADQVSSPEGWRLVADPEVLPGGCHVESEQASVVASLDARAAGLAHTLLMQS